MDSLIELKNVSAAYDRQVVLRDINLTIFRDDFLGIIGPNGGGKTTLLKLLIGLKKPLSGEITYFGQNGNPCSQIQIGYLPQLSRIDASFPLSVRDIIASGLIAQKRIFKKFSKEQVFQIDEIIAQLELSDLQHRAVNELSGGQLQRVLLARAMVSKPQVLVLDEPNTYVDKQFEHKFYELLKEFNKITAIILVSHDIGTILSMVKNVACVDETLHYHQAESVSKEWFDKHFDCPIELIGHGNIPHRVFQKH